MFFKDALAAETAKKGIYGLPIQGSDVAVAWDHLYIFLFWLSVFFFVLVVGGMIYLAVVYRKKPGQKTSYIVDNHALEALWTVIPTVLLLAIFGWGWKVYVQMTRPPVDAMVVNVIAKQWLWNFQYEDGKLLTNEVYVPINQPVKFVMSSEDVLHSFFIPNFRVKSDVVPGMYTTIWFEAKVPGEHQVYCTEYCGASHSLMLAKVYALEPEKWEAWKRGKEVQVTGKMAQAPTAEGGKPAAPETLADRGKKLAELKGCFACHTTDGSANPIGPTWKGVFGHEVELADGSKVTADENYIRESILNPNAKQVKGFTPVMPPYQGLLSEEELGAVISYIKGLGASPNANTNTQVVKGE